MRQSWSFGASSGQFGRNPCQQSGSLALQPDQVARVIADWTGPRRAQSHDVGNAAQPPEEQPVSRNLPRCARHRHQVVQPRGGQTANLTRRANEIDETRRHPQVAHIVKQPGGFEDLPGRDSGRIRLTIRQQDQARVRVCVADRANRRKAGQCVAELSDPKNENRRHRATCAEPACSTEWSSSRTVCASPSVMSGHSGSENTSVASRSATGNLAAPLSSGLKPSCWWMAIG